MPTKMAIKIAVCVICSKCEDVRYKCPKCTAPYCSVSCCKAHKTQDCSLHPPTTSAEGEISQKSTPFRSKYRYPTEDTVPIEQLELLRDSNKLKEILENPHLRRMMEAIDQSTDASELVGNAMKEPIFTEMSDECLRILNGEMEVDSDGETV